MPVDIWISVFHNAAIPQRLLIVALVSAIPLILVALGLALRRPKGPWRRVIADIGFAGAGLGLLTGATNSFHMARTIQRLPYDGTLKQLAPGILEVSSLISLGTLVGLLALIAHGIATACDRVQAQVAIDL